jgi:hypothetical protein
LSGNEAEILRKLLEPEFPGRDELLQQLTYVSARQILDDGTLELHCEGAPKAQVTRRVPTEGEYLDADGHTVNVLLHVKNGLMCELEILKNYPTKILKSPQAGDLVVMARTSEA